VNRRGAVDAASPWPPLRPEVVDCCMAAVYLDFGVDIPKLRA
jgi:hypothetical protein